jgi:hypothetical protein
MEHSSKLSQEKFYRAKLLLPDKQFQKVTEAMGRSASEIGLTPKQVLIYTVTYPDNSLVQIKCERQPDGHYACEADLLVFVWGRYRLMDKVGPRTALAGVWTLEWCGSSYALNVMSDAAAVEATLVPELPVTGEDWRCCAE